MKTVFVVVVAARVGFAAARVPIGVVFVVFVVSRKLDRIVFVAAIFIYNDYN
jgi:hypothetical protein